MIRRAVSTGNDSDDERVTFDDEIMGGSQQENDAYDQVEVPASKHRHLLQYRKFKVDLDNDVDEEEDALTSNWQVEASKSKGYDFDFNTFSSKAPVKQPLTSSSKITEKSTKSTTVHVVGTNPKNVKSTKPIDVAADRPSHWKTSTLVKAKVEPRKPVLNDAKRIKTGHVGIKPVTASTSMGVSNLSFQPAWMRSSTSTVSESVNRVSADRSTVEDISEDVSEIFTGRGEQYHEMDNNWNNNLSSTAPLVSLTPQRTPAVGMSQSFGSGGSSSSANHRRYTSKARPGTIKAKFQKIMRDVDACENRMMSIPPTHLPTVKSSPSSTSGPKDIQDPRTRAHWMVDVEVTQVLPDRLPFRVINGIILFSYNKGGTAVAPITKVNNSRVEGDGIAYDSPDFVDDMVVNHIDNNVTGHVEGIDNVNIAIVSEAPHTASTPAKIMNSNVKNNNRIYNLEEGTICLIYFKPSTCTGSGRQLREGLAMRIYDPEVVISTCGENSENKVVLICTQCWEPAMGSIESNSI